MARPVTSFQSLGERVAAALEDRGAERRLAVEIARDGFLSSAMYRSRSTKHRIVLSAVAVITLAMISLALIVFVRLAQPLQFTVDGNSGAAQSWLAAPATRPLAVRFSDGTHLQVQPSTRARVVDIDRHGAQIALETGAIHAEVVHTNRSLWRIIAGPFTIRVTGTRFDVDWDSASEQFAIAVREGSVAVSGSIVDVERAVVAGQILRVAVAQRRLEWIAQEQDGAESAREALPSHPEQPAPVVQPARTVSPSSESVSEPTVKDKGTVSWRVFAHRGDLRGAFAAAEAAGFGNECSSASPSELLVLGDGARLSNRPDRAVEALTTLRRRFPRDPRRAAAAFALGKVAFDQTHSYREASEWFGTSRVEQPDGPLAREAAGRRIESLRNAGDLDGARAAAREYLGRYPDGPHAGIARMLR